MALRSYEFTLASDQDSRQHLPWVSWCQGSRVRGSAPPAPTPSVTFFNKHDLSPQRQHAGWVFVCFRSLAPRPTQADWAQVPGAQGGGRLTGTRSVARPGLRLGERLDAVSGCSRAVQSSVCPATGGVRLRELAYLPEGTVGG